MIFSSVTFLFYFLPIVLLGIILLPKKLHNTFLLIASLFFYAWGEVFYVFLMLASIILNYVIGLNIRGSKRKKLIIVSLGIAVNISLLIFFKYSFFLTGAINRILFTINVPVIPMGRAIHLPIGISFFTFQAMSYLIDIYRKEVEAERNPFNVGLFIALFPQLIAGPIIRYKDVATQIAERTVSSAGFYRGINRFVIGLAKKVLIADAVAHTADTIFAVSPSELSPATAWLGAICYAIQIYFDFSGYSDMAIGLGRMLGFKFMENFKHPYISASITEFWRRWHISLSTWFRDYLYIPLGGNRVSSARMCINLYIVFILCGLWHGAATTFLVWGIFHGTLLVIERSFRNKSLPGFLVRFKFPKHIITLTLVLLGWVIFRSESLNLAGEYIACMFGYAPNACGEYWLPIYFKIETLLPLTIGIVFSIPFWEQRVIRRFIRLLSLSSLPQKQTNIKSKKNVLRRCALPMLRIVFIMLLLWLCTIKIIAGGYSPFIYFRF